MNYLHFAYISNEADMEKDVPISAPEIITQDDVESTDRVKLGAWEEFNAEWLVGQEVYVNGYPSYHTKSGMSRGLVLRIRKPDLVGTQLAEVELEDYQHRLISIPTTYLSHTNEPVKGVYLRKPRYPRKNRQASLQIEAEEVSDAFIEDGQGFFTEVEDSNGIIFRYNRKGQRHNTRGPAVVNRYGTIWYYQNGKRHRTDGPAIVDVDGTVEYWVNDKQLSEEEFNRRYGQNRQASLEPIADLYHDKLYTVVPKDHDVSLGVMPEDQKFSRKYVFLWDTDRALTRFSDLDFKKILIILPKDVRFSTLQPLVGGAYTLPHILNTWSVEEIGSVSIHSE